MSEIGSVWNVAVMPDIGLLFASKNLIVNSPSTFNVSVDVSDVIAISPFTHLNGFVLNIIGLNASIDNSSVAVYSIF